MQQHIGIVGIGHGAGALFAFDAAAQFGHGCIAPKRGYIIIVFTQIAYGFGADTAAPQVAIGCNMCAGPAGITGNHLVAFVEHALGHLVILGAEGLRKAGNTFGRRLLGLLAEEIGNFVIIVRQRRNAPAHRVQLDALFGHFGNVAIWLQKLEPCLDLHKAMGVKAADYRVHRQHQIFMLLLQSFEPTPRFHGERPVALHAADVVVLVADTVQAQVDANGAIGALAAHARHFFNGALRQHAVGGDGDDFGLAVPIGADDQVVQVFAQEGFPAGKGHIKGRAAQAGKHFVPLFQGQIIVGLAPDVAGAALAVAAKADADDHREGFDFGPAKGAKGPVERQFGDESDHGLSLPILR